jgi:tetratricopeptide (TPR) repeat protein
MRTMQKNCLRYLPLLAAVLSSGCGNLTVTPAGCEPIDGGASCVLGADGQVRLFVEQRKPAPLRAWLGFRSLPLGQVMVDGGTLLRLSAKPGVLRIVERDGLSIRSYRLRLQSATTAPWLREARHKWESDQAQAAEAQLTQGLAQPQSEAARAEALGMLGRIRREQQRIADAKTLLNEALRLDESSGRLMDEAKETLALAAIYIQNEANLEAAEKLIESKRAVFDRFPALQPWFWLHRSTIRKTRGDLQGALEALQAGRLIARRYGEEQVLGALRQSAATVLQSLGRWDEAYDEVLGLPDERRGQPCLQANAYEMQGWLEIIAHELKLPVAGNRRPRDPREALTKALEVRQQRCKQIKPMASTLTNLSRAALVLGDRGQAASYLAAAQKLLAVPDPATQQTWAELSGGIALLAGDLPAALAHFQKLLTLSYLRTDGSSDKIVRDLYDTEWRAHLGLAKTLSRMAQGDSAAETLRRADAEFRLAEAFLDERSLDLSLTEGRVSYLGRHEGGTAEYLAFLHAGGRDAEALSVMRSARVRGLRALLRLGRMHGLTPAARKTWDEHLKLYREIRDRLDITANEAAARSEAERRLWNEERRNLELQLAPALEQALAVLGEAKAQPPPTVAAEETLLSCHPLPQDWLCAWMREGKPVQARRLPSDIWQHPDDLIREMKEDLPAKQRLRVLLYGPQMEQVDFGRLRLDGSRLEDSHQVVYALDLAKATPNATGSSATTAADTTGGRVLWVNDPTDEIKPGNRPTLNLSSQTGWQVHAVPIGARVATAELLSLLTQNDLFLYFGHAHVESHVSRRFLRTGSPDSGVQATDLLTLTALPRLVVLLACSSGLAQEAAGGVAGLGVAQAFLLGGSDVVIATTKDVDQRVGKAIFDALLAPGLGALSRAPGEQLRLARLAAEVELQGHPELARDLASFRVFVH